MAKVPFPGLFGAAQDLAQSQVQAYIDSITRSSQRETKHGQRYIRQLAHSFANELSNIASGTGQTFNSMEREQSAADAAMANYLQGGGQNLAQDIGSQLSYSPEAAAKFGGGQADIGANLGRVSAGFGAQSMHSLLGAEGSERAFGQALPGIAALSGIQAAAGYQQQQSDQLAAQRDQILGQLPSMTADLYSSFAQTRNQQDSNRLQAMGVNADLQQRLDQTHDAVHDEVQSLLVNPLTGQPLPQNQQPDYSVLYERAAAVYRERYPSRSDTWIRGQVEQTLERLGLTNPSAMQGFLGQVLGPTSLSRFASLGGGGGGGGGMGGGGGGGGGAGGLWGGGHAPRGGY